MHGVKFSAFLGCAHQTERISIGLHDLPLIFSKIFSLATLARLETRNSGMQLEFINHSYIFLYFMFFCSGSQFQNRVAEPQIAFGSYTIIHKLPT